MDHLVQEVSKQVLDVLKNNKIDINSPFAIITKSMEVVNSFQHFNGHEKKALVLRVLKKIAAGKDGIAGTEDDIIPPKVMEQIQKLLESGLVDDYTKVLSDVVKGKFDFDIKKMDMSKAAEVVIKTAPMCFSLCGGASTAK